MRAVLRRWRARLLVSSALLVLAWVVAVVNRLEVAWAPVLVLALVLVVCGGLVLDLLRTPTRSGRCGRRGPAPGRAGRPDRHLHAAARGAPQRT